MDDNDEVLGGPAHGWWRLPVAALAAIALLGAIGIAIDDSDTDVSATSATTTAPTTTSTTVEFTTQTTVPFEVSSTTTTPTVATTVVTAAPATTVAAASCRNSTRSSCGAFRWDPQPAANRPISIEVRWDVTSPRAGEEVLFNVSVVDPDASPIKEGACGNSTGMSFGDSGSIPTSCSRPCGTARYGPWTPPAAARGAATFQYRHTYGAPGTYSPVVAFASSDGCNPYASVHHLTFQITVTE